MASNELSTSSSYYLMYRTRTSMNLETTSAAQILIPEAINDSDEEVDDGDSRSRTFRPWVEDEWTTKERSQAANVLEQNMQRCAVPKDKIHVYEEFAKETWDKFYQHNQSNFFKDRHYLYKAFPEELALLFPREGDGDCSVGDGASTHPMHTKEGISPIVDEAEKKIAPATNGRDGREFILAEVGCGVGNALLPLIDQSLRTTNQSVSFRFVGSDISHVAIDILKRDERYMNAHRDNRADVFVWDITSADDPPATLQNIAHVTLVLFCFSALSPNKMARAASNVAATLQPGGTMLFRDYGRFDEAQMKLGTSRRRRLGEHFYVKQDGTRCYYFDLEDLRRLFGEAGLEEVDARYLRRKYFNRGDGTVRRRVWVQAKFRKPSFLS